MTEFLSRIGQNGILRCTFREQPNDRNWIVSRLISSPDQALFQNGKPIIESIEVYQSPDNFGEPAKSHHPVMKHSLTWSQVEIVQRFISGLDLETLMKDKQTKKIWNGDQGAWTLPDDMEIHDFSKEHAWQIATRDKRPITSYKEKRNDD